MPRPSGKRVQCRARQEVSRRDRVVQVKPNTATNPGFGMQGVDPASLTGPEGDTNNIMFGAQYLRARMGGGDPNNPAVQAAGLHAYNGGGDPNYVANVFRYRPTLAPSIRTRSPPTRRQPLEPRPPPQRPQEAVERLGRIRWPPQHPRRHQGPQRRLGASARSSSPTPTARSRAPTKRARRPVPTATAARLRPVHECPVAAAALRRQHSLRPLA